MDYDDDDFDPDSHTAEEIAAHDFERLEHLFNTNPQVREVYYLDRELDTQQRGLEQLQQDDPVGLVWFGQSDQYGDPDVWLEKRLSRNPPE